MSADWSSPRKPKITMTDVYKPDDYTDIIVTNQDVIVRELRRAYINHSVQNIRIIVWQNMINDYNYSSHLFRVKSTPFVGTSYRAVITVLTGRSID